MTRKIKIAPSILSADFAKMGSEVKRLEESGADMVHCDVMDGVFVKNLSFGPKMVEAMRQHTKLTLDCHLMIVNPQNYIKAFADAGADIITVHYEATGDKLKDVLNDIKALGKKCGAVISPDTPAEALSGVVSLCDMILVMSVYPGFGGQKFIESMTDKVAKLRRMIDNSGARCDLQIDGGINFENAGKVISAGANVLVAGSSLYAAPDMRAAIQEMRGY